MAGHDDRTVITTKVIRSMPQQFKIQVLNTRDEHVNGRRQWLRLREFVRDDSAVRDTCPSLVYGEERSPPAAP